MTVKPRGVLGVLCVGAILWAAYPCGAAAREDDDGPAKPKRRVHPRDPERMRQRLDSLLEEGVSEDDPRVQRLRRMIETMDRHRRGRGPGAADHRGPRGSRAGLPRHSPEQIREFVEQHPELQRLFKTMPDGTGGSPERFNKTLRRFGRQVSEIMSAIEEGHEDLADLMIDNAGTQFSIAHKLREYRNAEPDSPEKDRLRSELAELVERQVAIDLDVEQLHLQLLRERLDRQEQRLASDRERQEALAARKLERILSGKRRGRRPNSPEIRDSVDGKRPQPRDDPGR